MRSMRLAIKPHGVLGTVMHPSGAISKLMPEPPPGLPLLDPAGLHHIVGGGPRDAGGAAGQIYRWLGIDDDDSFPQPVCDAIREPLQAKLHFYGQKAVVHVVGPDFRGRQCSQEAALADLTQAYGAVLREFATARLGGLRMLPVSGGIFAGDFAKDLPSLTAVALRRAFDLLPDQAQHVVSVARLDMCIFMESEYKLFVEAFKEEIEMTGEYDRSLGMGSTPKL